MAQARLFKEPAPSTLVYRQESTRQNMQSILDFNSLKSVQRRGSIGGAEFIQESQPSDGNLNLVRESSGKLNWKNGVLIPCLLNIWGVIMFLRLGWVVGQAGIGLAIVIILFSNVVTTITSLSLCAICTNGEVKGGGAYYLISRALGPVYGGTIGILFFIAQAVATSMYVVGFAESVVEIIQDQGGVDSFSGDPLNDVRIIGLGVSVILLMVAYCGIGWYAKCQIGLLVVLIVALFSVFVGSFLPKVPNQNENVEAGFKGYGVRNLDPNFQTEPALPDLKQTFFTVFAVFFPAVTGIMAGANISGDLKDPSHAIPKGTLLAIVISAVSYVGLVFVIGFSCVDCVGDACPEKLGFDKGATPEYLSTIEKNESLSLPVGGLLYNKLIMKNVSVFAPLLYIGVFAATLSSALASLVGAPRILQSVAADKIFPFEAINYFAKGMGPNNEPIRAYVLTFFICCAFVAIAKLDVIAPLISNFFMLSYAFTNYACFASSYSKSTGWRPSFKYYNKWLSLFGSVLCVVVMFLSDWIASIVTFGLALLICCYLSVIDPDVNWGAAGEAIKYTKAIQHAERLQDATKSHVKTFRPQFLVMTGPLEERNWLVKFTSLLQKGYGIMVCGDVVISNNNDSLENTEKEYKDDSVTLSISDVVDTIENSHVESAEELARNYELVAKRRKDGEYYLQNRSIWNKRCRGGFCEAVVAKSVLAGFQQLLYTTGFGKMRPNTVVFGFKHQWKSCPKGELAEYERMVRTALSAHYGVLIVRDDQKILNINVKTTWRGRLSVSDSEKKKGLVSNSDKPVTQVSDDPGVNGISSQPKIRPSLPATLPGSRIDVWWIADDGGLTMLLPYLLKQSNNFRSHRLRVYTLTETADTEETLKLQRRELRMIHLLNKFRIKAETKGVKMNHGDQVKPELLKKLEQAGISYDSLSQQEKIRTDYNFRLADLVRENSSDASLVFITLPIPETGIRVGLFQAWLHILSDINPPMVLLRGNNDSVLTFLC